VKVLIALLGMATSFAACGLLSRRPNLNERLANRQYFFPRRHSQPIRVCSGLLKRSPCPMLETIAVVLIVLWLLGLVTSASMGGLIHILLVVAIIIILIRLIRGKRL
jgi:hypothetical protein